jgi:hypothetical protein
VAVSREFPLKRLKGEFFFSLPVFSQDLRVDLNTQGAFDKIAHEHIHSAVSTSQVKESGMLGLYVAKGYQFIYAFAEFG